MDPLAIRYVRRGHGSPLLLVHGLGHRRQAWRPLLPTLAARHDVIAVDLPGFGQSPPPAPDEPYDIPALVETLRALCEALGIARPHIAGNSLGGALALELGARGLAASVTALSPVGFASGRDLLITRLLLRGMGAAARVPEPVRCAAAESRPARAIARRMMRADPSAPAARNLRFDAKVLSTGSPFVRLAPQAMRYVYAGTAPQLCPVTIAWGDRDRVLPARGAQRALRRMPQVRQVTLLGCGHVPMSDDPGAVAETILATCRAGERERTDDSSGQPR